MELFIDEFSKIKDYEKCKKRLRSTFEHSTEVVNMQEFIQFVQKRRKISRGTGLSFALNLEDDEAKFALKSTDIITKCKVKRKVTKEEVPKAFISHVISLGFQSCDAEALYENKDDWMGLNTGKLEHKND